MGYGLPICLPTLAGQYNGAEDDRNHIHNEFLATGSKVRLLMIEFPTAGGNVIWTTLPVDGQIPMATPHDSPSWIGSME